jgi:hypothetical protein
MTPKRDESGRFLPEKATPMTPAECAGIVWRYTELKESKHAIAYIYRRSHQKIRRVLIDAGIPNRIRPKKTTAKVARQADKLAQLNKPTQEKRPVVQRTAPKGAHKHYAPNLDHAIRKCCSSLVKSDERCFCRQPVRVVEHMPVLVRGDMGLLLPKRRVSV